LSTSEELLSGIVPDDTLADLLNDPGGVDWKDPEIERKLRLRLRKAFPSYLETIADMNEVTSILKAKLELDPDGKVDSNNPKV
jgi:hypothetical protein